MREWKDSALALLVVFLSVCLIAVGAAFLGGCGRGRAYPCDVDGRQCLCGDVVSDAGEVETEVSCD